MLSNIPINLLSETQLGKLFGVFIQSLLVDEFWGVGVIWGSRGGLKTYIGKTSPLQNKINVYIKHIFVLLYIRFMTTILEHQSPRAQRSAMNGRLWLKGSCWRKKGVESRMKRERAVADTSAEEEASVIWLRWTTSASYPQMTRRTGEWSSSWRVLRFHSFFKYTVSKL